MRASSATSTRICLARGRDVDPQQLFDRLHVGYIVGHRGQIVKSVGIGDKLVKRFHLGDFLLAAMQIAEVRRAFHHLFPVELKQQPQYPMRTGMLRTHVNHHAAQTACDGLSG